MAYARQNISADIDLPKQDPRSEFMKMYAGIAQQLTSQNHQEIQQQSKEQAMTTIIPMNTTTATVQGHDSFPRKCTETNIDQINFQEQSQSVSKNKVGLNMNMNRNIPKE